MCAYSFVADHYRDQFEPKYQDLWHYPTVVPVVSKDEFDRLKEKVEEMKKLLERAAEYDRRTGQPDCEMEDKIAFLRKVAEFVGVPDAVKDPHQT